MKYIFKIALSLMLVLIINPVWAVTSTIKPIASTSATNFLSQNKTDNFSEKHDMRGLWVSTVVNIDYPEKPTTDSEVLKSEAVKILEYAKNTGFNAVFLQVRPTADALYPSKYFPWSKYLTGQQGYMPDNGFDPLAYWVSEAHKRNIELHAWINPYRITKKSAGEPEHYFSSLASYSPAITNPTWVVKHTDGNLYFDPGIPGVRKLIIDGVIEITDKYDIDGIHFDDYFYPDKNFNDKATYQQYHLWGQTLDDWRRDNVNTMIREVYKAIKATGKNIRFGISPFGIWANKATNPSGSDTNGLESLNSHYADSLTWIKDGIIDYITPQIYWNIGYKIADYSKLVSWWKDAVSGTDVDLYIGQAAYRAGSSDPSSAWYGTAEIERQMNLNLKIPEIKGSLFFTYNTLASNPALSASIKAIYEQREGKAARIPVSISRPSENIRTSLKSFYLNGASDPEKPLYLNGVPVENRSVKGYFGVLVQLEEGANSFTLSQEASYATCVIHRSINSASPVKMSRIEIPPSSVFPQEQEYRMPGEKITLSCQAPAGSKVTVKIGGKLYSMSSSTAAPNNKDLISATYTYAYNVPSYSGAPRIIDLGEPIYSINYKGTVKTQKAPGRVGVIMKGAPLYAEVDRDVIDTYIAPVTGNGAAYELYKGMADLVTGMTGSYARLSSGQWVFKSQIKITAPKTRIQPVIKKAEYINDEKWDTLKLELSGSPAAIASFDGTALKMDISADCSAARPKLPEGSMFSSIAASSTGIGTQYTLTIKQNQRIDGYYIEKTASGLELKIKRRVFSKDENMPLSGITIMLDPGHGGTETGAIGPLGIDYAEKDINLKLSQKLRKELEAMGARVITTRDTDITVSLTSRLAASRSERPDLFISVHANSMPDNVDISRIDGFSVFYNEPHAKPVSEVVYEYTTIASGRNRHGVRRNNFYVVRGTWTPSILIETGFVPNPDEYEWLTDETEQAKLAKTLSEAILSYFSR